MYIQCSHIHRPRVILQPVSRLCSTGATDSVYDLAVGSVVTFLGTHVLYKKTMEIICFSKEKRGVETKERVAFVWNGYTIKLVKSSVVDIKGNKASAWV